MLGNLVDLEFEIYVMADMGCFCLNVCCLFESAPVLSVESETCLGLSEKEGGLKKGEISKGEKWLSPCMYVLHCCHSYLLMGSRHRTAAPIFGAFCVLDVQWCLCQPVIDRTVIDNIFLHWKHSTWQNHWIFITNFPQVRYEKTINVKQTASEMHVSPQISRCLLQCLYLDIPGCTLVCLDPFRNQDGFERSKWDWMDGWDWTSEC